jgi:hypothetical protein
MIDQAPARDATGGNCSFLRDAPELPPASRPDFRRPPRIKRNTSYQNVLYRMGKFLTYSFDPSKSEIESKSGVQLSAQSAQVLNEDLPDSLVALMARLESAERVARGKARVDRLRRGLA